ncbi:LysR family transcriptional regulator [Streptomyces sp. NPDC050658]|uniref:LysR family transcriptional regulator n=1 Tax=unclassified Streptomyces TaxID=2593676 RepID=UPI003422E074
MELRQLRYFRAVADEGNLSRAAETLGLRSSSLSEQIIALERQLGVELFRRTPAGMAPTAAGTALLPHARAVIAAASAAEECVRDTASERRWRVGVTPGSPHTVIARLWDLLRDAGAVAEPVDASTAEQVGAVRRGDLDAGLVCLPVDDRRLSCRVVSDEPLGVLMAERHRLAAAGTTVRLTWDDLFEEQLLWFPREFAPGYHDDVLAACHAAGWWPRLRARPPRRALFTAELRAGRDLIALRPRTALADGTGLAWRPLSGAPRLRHALVWRADGGQRRGSGVAETMEGVSALLHPA